MTDLFLLESLHDGKSSRALDVLHDKPIDSPLILAINVGGLDELRFQACDGVWLVVTIEMHGDSVGIPSWKSGGYDRDLRQRSKSSKMRTNGDESTAGWVD